MQDRRCRALATILTHAKAKNVGPAYTIRCATERDAAEIARLFTILGHPSSAETVRAQWDDWPAASDFTLVAAQSDGRLLGVATLNRMIVLHRPAPVGRISSLVVDIPCRGEGIGRALVAAAEDVLRNAGCRLLEVTSNERRNPRTVCEISDGPRNARYASSARRLVRQTLGPRSR